MEGKVVVQLKARDWLIAFSLLVLFLGACSTTPSTALPETPSLPFSPTIVMNKPTPTQLPDTQEPAVIKPDQAIIDGLYRVGIHILNENDSEPKSWELSYNGIKVPGAIVDERGLTITINTGPITIPSKRVRESVHVVDGAIIIDYTPGTHTAVFDPAFTTEKWGGRWVSKYEALKENYDGVLEAWVQVSTYAEALEAVRLGKLLSREFPEGTYLPPLDKLYVDYDDDNSKGGDYNSRFPFGTREDFRNNLPFMFVNHILVSPNDSEDRNYYACILQQAVYNSDGTKGILNFSTSEDTQDECIGIVGGMRVGIDHYENGDYILPVYSANRSLIGVPFARFMVDSLSRNGLIDSRGILDAKLKEYVREWFSTGVLPEELENVFVWGPTRTFEKWE